MKPRITVITLGVDDLERACEFYRDGLGLKTDGITGTEFEYGAVAFFELEGNLRLALWPRKSLAHVRVWPRRRPAPRNSRSATTWLPKTKWMSSCNRPRRRGR